MSKCTLIQGDCLEEMDKLIDEGVKVDLTVTSPPYDDLRTYQDEIDWNFNIFKEIIKAASAQCA
jgi:site-specific DNA-methyltransferase (adenine-specific)